MNEIATEEVTSMYLRKGYLIFSLVLLMTSLLAGILFSGPMPRENKSNLSDTFMRIRHTEKYLTFEKKNVNNKITSLFIRPQGKATMEITMLIACSRNITNAAREILNKKITPLVFSVSTLPFVSTEFYPEDFSFIQDGRSWSPNKEEAKHDMFALGENGKFGGTVVDSQVHQGVILLPEWFDLTKQVTIKYGNFMRKTLFSY